MTNFIIKVITLSLLLLSFNITIYSQTIVTNSININLIDTSRIYKTDSIIPTTGDTINNFTPQQDSLFQQKLFQRLLEKEKLKLDFTFEREELIELLDSINNTPLAIMKRNLTFNPKDILADPRDVSRRNEDIYRSLYGWDSKRPITLYPFTLSISMGSIGRFLGVIEDVTPRIKYMINKQSKVSVKIYDHTSILIRNLVDANQNTGSYSFDWDMKNDKGVKVLMGDYVVEIIIDGKPYKMNKRIEVP